MNREVLKELNIIGATMVFQENEHCKPTIDWLLNFCEKVIICLDNFNFITEQIILDYKEKFGDKIIIVYSNIPVNDRTNKVQGQPKKRFKGQQPNVRETVLKRLRELGEEEHIDLFIFLDSDELPINQFGEVLKEFWENRPERYLMCGFIEPFENYNTIMTSRMAPHSRVFKFDKTISALPPKSRTRYCPYYYERCFKVRNLIAHLCRLTDARRKQRQFFDNCNWIEESLDKDLWQLPKSCLEMTVDELADYQVGQHQKPAKFPPITLREYLQINNK